MKFAMYRFLDKQNGDAIEYFNLTVDRAARVHQASQDAFSGIEFGDAPCDEGPTDQKYRPLPMHTNGCW